jgi:plasmid stability protein
MATIQIRNVPDAVHRAYRARAAAAGMSLQEFLLADLISGARLRSPAELIAEVSARQHAEGVDGFSQVSSAEVIRRDRDAH